MKEKLKRKGWDVTLENALTKVYDAAGVRIICGYIDDVYEAVTMLKKYKDLKVVTEKDYIKNPKPSGYKSYHMLVTIPIYLSDKTVDTKVEIQIRTIGMDFWASLEHKIYYKFEGNAPEYISRDLRECSEIVSMMDTKMLQLNNAIMQTKLEEQEKQMEERRHKNNWKENI
jgi:putative GTP pyrophosphokinase